MADNRIEVVLKIFFLTFSSVDIQFIKKEHIWRIYSIIKALLTTWRVEIIDR